MPSRTVHSARISRSLLLFGSLAVLVSKNFHVVDAFLCPATPFQRFETFREVCMFSPQGTSNSPSFLYSTTTDEDVASEAKPTSKRQRIAAKLKKIISFPKVCERNMLFLCMPRVHSSNHHHRATTHFSFGRES